MSASISADPEQFIGWRDDAGPLLQFIMTAGWPDRWFGPSDQHRGKIVRRDEAPVRHDEQCRR
jgi:hypothetical protein